MKINNPGKAVWQIFLLLAVVLFSFSPSGSNTAQAVGGCYTVSQILVYTDGVLSSTGGSVAVTPATGCYSTATITATPNTNYGFWKWFVYNAALPEKGQFTNPVDITLTNNATVEVHFSTKPAHDNFANRKQINQITYEDLNVNVTGATMELGDPDNIGPCTSGVTLNKGSKTVWYYYDSKSDLRESISLIAEDTGYSPSAYIAVWKGSVAPANLIGCNDSTNTNSGFPELVFVTDPSTTYYIEVGEISELSSATRGNYQGSGGILQFRATIRNVQVDIGGLQMGTYLVPSSGRVTPIYQGVNNGPVRVTSKVGANLIASERAYRNAVTLTDFNEMMGLPANQLWTEYWFPLSDSTSFMQTYITIGNASSDSVNQPSANVSVYIAGQLMGSSVIPYGGRWTPIYQGINNGPVRVVSTNAVPIITSERAYRNAANLSDFNEMMGFPANQLTTEYWFPLSDSTSFMQTYITIGNASSDSVNKPSANVSVYIAGQLMGSSVIPYGGRWTPIYQGINNGPVRVVSTNAVPIITSERAYRNGTNLTDFNEMMGFPANRLWTEYWFPLSDSTSFMQTYITIGNASSDSVNKPSANVSVYIAGQLMGSSVIPYGGRWTPIYQGINNGPVRVVSTNAVPIIASERAYRGANLTDFNEMMGVPANQLWTEYWFPLSDSTSFMQTYITIGNTQ